MQQPFIDQTYPTDRMITAPAGTDLLESVHMYEGCIQFYMDFFERKDPLLSFIW